MATTRIEYDEDHRPTREDADASEVPPVVVAMDRLSPAALDGLITEFVTRDGTDYGAVERTLEQKKAAIRRQLEREEIAIVFDPRTETCTIVDAKLVRGLR